MQPACTNESPSTEERPPCDTTYRPILPAIVHGGGRAASCRWPEGGERCVANGSESQYIDNGLLLWTAVGGRMDIASSRRCEDAPEGVRERYIELEMNGSRRGRDLFAQYQDDAGQYPPSHRGGGGRLSLLFCRGARCNDDTSSPYSEARSFAPEWTFVPFPFVRTRLKKSAERPRAPSRCTPRGRRWAP